MKIIHESTLCHMHLQLYFSRIFSHTDILLLIITVESKNYFANFHIISSKFTVYFANSSTLLQFPNIL